MCIGLWLRVQKCTEGSIEMAKSPSKIDFVVFWVDGSDPKWQGEKKKWEKKLKIVNERNVDNSEIRYRDWGLLKYWFRGVEKFAPWVNKIHFVTCGQLPEWLNVDHPKLHVVKHSDYMPEEALPTFNSNAIELMMHKIDGLAEEFVAFNDDFYLTNYVRPDDFFKNGNPVNAMSLCSVVADPKTPYYRTLMNDIEIINKHFDYRKSIKENRAKYLSLKQGKYLLRTLPALGYAGFPGFANYHVPVAYLKSTFDELWQKEPDVLKKTVFTRFRNYETDVNHWVFNYWQYAKGDFVQKTSRLEKNMTVANSKIPDLIARQQYRVICIGDAEVENVDGVFAAIAGSFDEILPEKSEFER